VTIKSLFDTGADVSCLRTKVFESTKLKVPIENRKFKNFKAAGGNKLDIAGKVTVPIEIDKRQVSHPFYLIDNLNEKCILGIDFITKHQLNYCPQTRMFFWPGEKPWLTGIITTTKAQTISALTSKVIKVNVVTDQKTIPNKDTVVSACVGSETKPLLTSDLGLASVTDQGQINILVKNCAPCDITLVKDEIIGKTENLQGSQFFPINTEMFCISTIKCKPAPTHVRDFIQSHTKMNVPDSEKGKYLALLQEHWETFSLTKNDLGLCTKMQHDIELKTKEPIYVKQFRIPEAHMKEVKTQLTEWLKLGVVEPCRSKYNSPIFVVAKKDGGLRIVQDFRALNTQTFVDKYSMHDVNECVAEIGRAGSTIFSTLDLTSGFWQMQLKPEVKRTTAFTIPGMGQYCWTVAPMGLLGSPASFQRLVEHVLEGIPHVIVYIDDLIIHTTTHQQHRDTLRLVFDRLRANNLKVNLKKCEFGSTNVSYLGFRLTPDGIKPGIDKLKAVGTTPPPTSIREVRQFLGLCNFFRAHVKNFAFISHPLTVLTRKDCKWKRGPLPPEALKAFRELQTILCSEPVIDYPRKNRPYVLITDASFGDEKTPGGLGAILTQVDEKNEHRVIAYASRKLAKHEKNYTPFLLEMQAALWAMDHFHVYLKGNHFTLMTDHKPLETMGTIHTKTLNRLQEAMNTEYSFSIVYKKGAEMPADFLSRNAIDSIQWENQSLQQEQRKDPILEAIINFLYNRQLPSTSVMQGLVKLYANDCFMENGLLWRRLKRQGDTAHIVLFVPESMKIDVLKEAHGGQFTGHDGIFKTKERILHCYYWPGMDKDINDFIKRCHKCQQRTKSTTPHTELQPLPQCSQPNQRIHADLFGPLKTSGSGKKYVLCITDAFTKYIELVALPDKEAQTVAEGLFNRWICRYGSPLQITTDGGKEFCAKLSEQLYQLMKIEHLTTSPYHPQCNSQAEIVNKTIAKYLSSFVDETTLDWELYLPPLMFSYNTSMHSTTKFTPYFLTYGQQPRAPHFPAPDLARKFYGESSIDEMWMRLQQARQLAIKNNEAVRDNYEQKYNKEIVPINYTVGQEVFLDEHNFLHKNKKLAPQFSGPHIIEKLIGKTNAQLKLKNGKSTIIHLNRLKPFLSQSDKLIEHPIVTPQQQQVEIHPSTLDLEEEDDDPLTSQHNFSGHPKRLLPTLATPPITVGEAGAARRKRGRPPKRAQVTAREEGHVATPTSEAVPTAETVPPPERRMTRSQLQQMSEEQKAEYFVAISFIDALKQLASHTNSSSKKKIVKNKQDKNGTKHAKWSKLQKSYFKTYGDTYGHTVTSTPTINPGDGMGGGDNGDGHESSSDSESEHSDSGSELSGSEHSDSEHPSEHSSGESQPSTDSSQPDEKPEERKLPSSSSDEFVDAREAPEGQDKGRGDPPKKPVQEAADKMAKAEAPIAPRPVSPVPPDKLPFIQGPEQSQRKSHPVAPQKPVKPSSSAVFLHRTQKVPHGARSDSQGTVPPSFVHPKTTGQSKDDNSRNVDKTSQKGAQNTGLHKMGPSTTKKDDKVRQEPVRSAGTKTGATAKPSVTVKRLIKPVQPPHKDFKRTTSDIGLLAKIVGLSPSGLTQEDKSSLLGDLIYREARSPVSPLASPGSHSGLDLAQHEQAEARPKTPDIPTTIKWASYQNEQEAKKAIKKRQELQEKEPQGASRPLRSNFQAKPILAPPKLSLERQIAKQLKEDKVKNKLDELEKTLLKQEEKEKSWKKK
jgi:hypothetical protein